MAHSPTNSPLTSFRAQNSHAPEPPRMQYGPVGQIAVAPDIHQPIDSPTIKSESAQRTRHSSACFPCAKRKVKCDRDIKNPCSNCLKRGQPEGCQLKTQKDRLSQSRSEAVLRDEEEDHRDKRPRYDQSTYQVAFQSAPTASSSPGPQREPDLASSVASNHVQYSAVEQSAPVRPTAPSSSSRKSKEALLWDSVEPLLPQRKDLLKYIGTYRIAPHVVNPVISNLDSFESHVCTFLEEVGTPKIKQRLASKDRRASEVELGRLARLLAVLASGARYEDSDYNAQLTVSREYVRKAFQCLRLANYMLRPTLECIQTLLLLAAELQNDHQLSTAWALLGTTSRLAHSIGISLESSRASVPDRDAVVTGWSIAWQDVVLSVIHQDFDSIRPNPTGSKERYDDPDSASLEYLRGIYHFYAMPVQLLKQEPMKEFAIPTATLDFLDQLRASYKEISFTDCKSMRDRYELAAFKLHASYMLSRVLGHFRDAKGGLSVGANGNQYNSSTPETTPGAGAQHALVTVIQTFVEFSAISNVPLRTWIMVHYALSAALSLCQYEGSRTGTLLRDVLPKLMPLLGVGTSTDIALSSGHSEAVQLLNRVWKGLQAKFEDEPIEIPELPPHVRGEAAKVQAALANTEAATMESQSLWGL